MKPSVAASVLAILLSGFSLVAAQQQSACVGKPLTEAHSLEILPAQLNSLLGRDRSGLEGIADRNGKFNVTDVVDNKLPCAALFWPALVRVALSWPWSVAGVHIPIKLSNLSTPTQSGGSYGAGASTALRIHFKNWWHVSASSRRAVGANRAFESGRAEERRAAQRER